MYVTAPAIVHSCCRKFHTVGERKLIKYFQGTYYETVLPGGFYRSSLIFQDKKKKFLLTIYHNYHTSTPCRVVLSPLTKKNLARGFLGTTITITMTPHSKLDIVKNSAEFEKK